MAREATRHRSMLQNFSTVLCGAVKVAAVFSAMLAVGITFGIAYAYAHLPQPGPSFHNSPAPARTPDTPPHLAPHQELTLIVDPHSRQSRPEHRCSDRSPRLKFVLEKAPAS